VTPRTWANVFDVPRVTLVDNYRKNIVGEGTKASRGSLLGPGRDRARREDGRPDDAPIARPEGAVVRRYAGEYPRERIGRAVEIEDDDQTSGRRRDHPAGPSKKQGKGLTERPSQPHRGETSSFETRVLTSQPPGHHTVRDRAASLHGYHEAGRPASPARRSLGSARHGRPPRAGAASGGCLMRHHRGRVVGAESRAQPSR
jgi:hypothetical protein